MNESTIEEYTQAEQIFLKRRASLSFVRNGIVMAYAWRGANHFARTVTASGTSLIEVARELERKFNQEEE